ncbi:hypothetical protein GE061_019738 [Apolygus lucorum]|uniref:FZ domain-containing protein n=1 Tax=Apolygus lucorum TaxID=248454 RepID=A0A8S9XDB5_APOLU|nr:hypothetical protein GE061_019738 [Apolygus lucorum]
MEKLSPENNHSNHKPSNMKVLLLLLSLVAMAYSWTVPMNAHYCRHKPMIECKKKMYPICDEYKEQWPSNMKVLLLLLSLVAMAYSWSVPVNGHVCRPKPMIKCPEKLYAICNPATRAWVCQIHPTHTLC